MVYLRDVSINYIERVVVLLQLILSGKQLTHRTYFLRLTPRWAKAVGSSNAVKHGEVYL